jgi:beta-xylosidase
LALVADSIAPTISTPPNRSNFLSSAFPEAMNRLKAAAISVPVVVLGVLAFCEVGAQAWQSDNGDGTFTNPPLHADYPDPDIIRVGDDFYFATTTFVNSPGLTILHSLDLVNWEIVSHVIPRLDGREQYDLKHGAAYRAGVFAPSLRYHDGMFFIAVTPVSQNTRVYYAKDIRGPWPYHELDRPAFDPGLFIASDGTGYIATSGGWDGHVTLLKLNRDFSKVVEARGIFYYPGIEGSKVIKRGDWYYIFNALPAKLGLTCSRATNIFGPYETIEPLNDRTGGHQGAIVDLPDGGWYGFVMKDCGAIGRMTCLSPIFWTNNWPLWGTPDAPGKVPATARKPVQGKPVCQPATSDDFGSPTLGLQWQWNHNPDNTRWSLTERPGFLRLGPTPATNFWFARNTLTQKGQGPWSRGEVKFDLSHLKPGDICGFGTLGKVNGSIAAICGSDIKMTLAMQVLVDGGTSETRVAAEPISGTNLFLRTDLDFVRNKGACAYSLDRVHWQDLGGEFDLAFDWRTGTFQGEQFAIFCFNTQPGEGYVDIDSFRFVGARE